MPTRKTRLSVPVEKEVLAKIESMATQRDVSVAAITREIIEVGLQSLHQSSKDFRLTADQLESLRAIVRQEVAAVIQEEKRKEPTAEEIRRRIDESVKETLIQAKNHRLITGLE
jgi:hypothetical protein